MFKILKNLKKTWISVVVIVLLLCLQAWADLTLPDYTSKIVNTGIQAGGIENVSPEAIRKSQMDTALLFTKEEESILNAYTLLSRDNLNDNEYEKNKSKYPLLETEEIYVLKDISKEERETLDEKMATPLMISNLVNQEEIRK